MAARDAPGTGATGRPLWHRSNRSTVADAAELAAEGVVRIRGLRWLAKLWAAVRTLTGALVAALRTAMLHPYFVFFQHPDDGMDSSASTRCSEEVCPWGERENENSDRFRGFIAYAQLFNVFEVERAEAFVTAASVELLHTNPQGWPLPPRILAQLQVKVDKA
jgi:hypothetical protein